MLTRLRHSLVRVFPGILLIVLGLLAALFRGRRPRRNAAGVPVPVLQRAPARPPAPRLGRRGGVFAFLALLIGIGLILALTVGGDPLRRLASIPPREGTPMAAVAPAEMGAGRVPGHGASAPAGSDRQVQTGAQGGQAPGVASDASVPAFDTVRVEPNGEFVVAGRATPGGTLEILVDGKPVASTVADANGQFAVVPPTLPTGNSEITLRVTNDQGHAQPSRESVAVVIAPSRETHPLVALTAPDRPTRVLSQPDPLRPADRPGPNAASGAQATATVRAPDLPRPVSPTPGGATSGANAPADRTVGRGTIDPGASRGPSPDVPPGPATLGSAEGHASAPLAGSAGAGAAQTPMKIVSIDAQAGGRLFVTGRSPAGSTVRLYLNDTLIAPASVGPDGTVTFAIGRGVKPGDYKVRLDQVDAGSGKVRSRVEVSFSVPAVSAAPEVPSMPEVPSVPDEARRTAEIGPRTTETARGSGRREGGESPGAGAISPMAATPTAPAQPGGTSDLARGPRASGDLLREREADPAIVFVPEVKTARIERGDSLWAISRRTYGEGDRYTAIYDANQDQIQNPDLIYPGQVFVLPSEDVIEAGQTQKRG
jgi:nucleoid-associated protein YgaU